MAIANGSKKMSTETLIRICSVEDVALGSAKHFYIDDLDLAVFNINGNFFITDDTCTHAPASLSEGCVDGDIVECPFHLGAFHIPTGKPVAQPCTIPLKTYKTVILNSEVFIKQDYA